MADPFMLKTYTEEQQWLEDETGRRQNPVIAKSDPRFSAGYTTKAEKYKPQQGTLLTWNQKTQCLSFDLPSLITCPGAGASLDRTKDALGESPMSYPGICTLCYASKGPYMFQNVRTTMQMRLEISKGPDFVDTMVYAISKRPKKYISGKYARKRDNPGFFRVHSSGDFYSGEYVRKWVEICNALPDIRFWFPTRVWAAPTHKMAGLIKPLVELSALPNVTIRPSMLSFNEEPYFIDTENGIRWAGPSGGLIFEDMRNVAVRLGKTDKRLFFKGMSELETKWQSRGVWFCPATPRDHESDKISNRWNCKSQNCRRCWLATDTPVVYRVH